VGVGRVDDVGQLAPDLRGDGIEFGDSLNKTIEELIKQKKYHKE
jgi:hypothetical protein